MEIKLPVFKVQDIVIEIIETLDEGFKIVSKSIISTPPSSNPETAV